MVRTLSGKILSKRKGFAVIEVGGLGLKVLTNQRVLEGMLDEGRETRLHCHLHVAEKALDLYGFRSEDELELFEQLITVSGVGPKSALAIMEVADLERLTAAIQEGRADLLASAVGVGKKTAARVVLELRGKVQASSESEGTVRTMEADNDLVGALSSLGYNKETAKAALAKVPPEVLGLEARLKAALKILGGNK